jgi:hypothetical protein
MDRGHEALAGGVAQPGSFAAHRFRNQKGNLTWESEDRGVKLDELRVGDGGAGPQRHAETVGGRALGIRGCCPETSRATGGEHRHRGFDQRQRSTRVQLGDDASAAPVHDDEIDDERAGVEVDVSILSHPCHEGAFDLGPGGIPTGV